MTWIKPMVGRSPDERHRASTPLELLFDLVLVVAVAFASSELHHDLAAGDLSGVLLSYCLVFFAIWWPWMNFTWFASAFDTDDVAHRLLVFVQMTGALIVAAGVPRLFEDLDLGLALVGYGVMRLAAVTQWLRAARSDIERRPAALRMAIGIGTLQLAWVLLYLAPQAMVLSGFLALIVTELAVPIWAERRVPTTWHPAHIAERYGLFTIIVLGESILSASIAVQTATDSGQVDRLLGLVVGGLLIVFAMWWLYFHLPGEDLLTSLRRAFVWGYGHYFIWASAAAVGAGLAVVLEQAAGQATIGEIGAGFAVAVPVALYLLGLWAIGFLPRSGPGSKALLGPLFAMLVLLTPLTRSAVLLTGLLLMALVAVGLVGRGELRSSELGVD